MTDIFEEKNIQPMLLDEIHKPFDSEDYIFELKLDGIRCVLYIDKASVEIRNKRNKNLNATYPELKDAYKQVKQRCILDGEIFVMKNGKPDFYEIQKRSIMTNTMKIEFAMKQYPVSFSAFDILYNGNEQITNKPQADRKTALQDNIIENERISISRFVPDKGIALYNLTVEQGLEGIVAKRKDSKYLIGKTTKDWVKIKNLQDDDFVICGYTQKDNGIASLILGVYSRNNLVYQGNVTLGISNIAFKVISSIGQAENPFPDILNFNENVIWIKPVLVCIVQYMMRTNDGGLRQPVFKGLRDDKDPHDCVIKQNIY